MHDKYSCFNLFLESAVFAVSPSRFRSFQSFVVPVYFATVRSRLPVGFWHRFKFAFREISRGVASETLCKLNDTFQSCLPALCNASQLYKMHHLQLCVWNVQRLHDPTRPKCYLRKFGVLLGSVNKH